MQIMEKALPTSERLNQNNKRNGFNNFDFQKYDTRAPSVQIKTDFQVRPNLSNSPAITQDVIYKRTLELANYRIEFTDLPKMFLPAHLVALRQSGWNRNDIRGWKREMLLDPYCFRSSKRLIVTGQQKKSAPIPHRLLNELICEKLQEEFTAKALSCCSIFTRRISRNAHGEIIETMLIDVDAHQRGVLKPKRNSVGRIIGLKVLPKHGRSYMLQTQRPVVDERNVRGFDQLFAREGYAMMTGDARKTFLFGGANE